VGDRREEAVLLLDVAGDLLGEAPLDQHQYEPRRLLGLVARIGQPDASQAGLGVMTLVDVLESRVAGVEGEGLVQVSDR
jgi:hypothetical protein